jgi:DNA-binding CsgD family transcriptional regulator
MTEVIDHLTAMTNAPSVEELWALHVARMADYGFDRLIYGFTRYMTSHSLGDPQDWVVLTNQPRSYMESFIDKGLYFHAPMLRWALENDGACSWSWMEEMNRRDALSPSERKVLDFNRGMGVTAGYTISFRSLSSRAKGAIALTARPGAGQAEVDALWARHAQEIILMNNILHLRLLTMPQAGARHLTRRQREVLEWVGDGKTNQDIATIMGLTSATVEKHLRLAREALDVDTTAQAVLKAAFMNQMFVLDA